MFKGLESEILPGLYLKAEFMCPCVMRLLGDSSHGGLQSWQRMERIMGPGLPFFMVSIDHCVNVHMSGYRIQSSG